MDLNVDLGPEPIDEHSGRILDGLRIQQDRNSELCDLELIVGGQSFMAHRGVLAAVSCSFHSCLTKLGSTEGYEAKPLTLKLDDISHPEAVKAMLDCIYRPSAEYAPSCEDANRDVLRLAQRFRIAQLQDLACRWLTTGLSTANVFERLLTCETFSLVEAREQILQLLTSNPETLLELAKDPEILKVPAVMQDLLIRTYNLLGVGSKAEAAGAESRAEAKPQAAAASAPPARQGRPGRKAGA
ncbi:unnamed protein product [Prorocentrum cordatum]|uniref:BTB domain-containing protein n=1 Tax=Prorocentrum cordatum TaxID=2364126 RepID=A0ABN9SQL1_9DINO|nr:unnamed protein product [Polarella glacialis]